ncbi:sigma-70 family RNA polymerase sigma factor [Pendulispora brunnea]|uniref:Sigma-70 family RNA polymerase sigma factor n=1 Tax=Pendulispora brunnea TaxID=2905690 RepID=A0ABZ2KM49_9BACT
MQAKLRLVTSRPAPAPQPTAPGPVTPALDDAQLIAAIRANDDLAATAFHDRLYPCVSRTIQRLLGRRDADYEDLIQLSMVELIQSFDRYRGECSLESWASTIASRAVYNHLRRRKRERLIFAPPPPDDLDPAKLSRTLSARNTMQRVRGHLAELNPEKAWTFLLHDVCGYDLREIATITGVSVAAAQTRLVRGRCELHERLAEDPELRGALETGAEP